MPILLRNILAVVLGIVGGSIVNGMLVGIGPLVVPPPAGVHVTDMQSLRESIHLFGPQHFIFPFVAHAAGTLAGALIAYLVAGSRRTTFAYVIGVFFLAGGIAAAIMIPAPAWFIAADLIIAYLPMAWLATRVGGAIVGDPATDEHVARA